MTTTANTKQNQVLRQNVVGSRRLSNYFWSVISAIGGVGFLLAGLSSYFKTNLLIVSDTSSLQFIPQGVALSFYGVAGSLVCLYLLFVSFLDVGGGYNEFDKAKGTVTIFRFGFPGKNRRIEITAKLSDIQSVRAEIKEGLNPQRTLYIRIKNRRDIPLTRAGQPISLAELENQGAELARFLQVPLEGL
jgi:Ycf4